jgi:hypothetical protein
MELNKYPKGTILFSGPDDDESIEQAKQFCLDNMLSKDDVRIVKMTIFLEKDVSSKIIAVILK